MLSILKLNIEGSAKKPNAPRNRLLLIYDFGPNQADIQAILPNWSYEGLNFKALNFYLRSFGLRILRTHLRTILRSQNASRNLALCEIFLSPNDNRSNTIVL